MDPGKGGARPFALKVLVVSVGLFAVVGMASGVVLLISPSGKLLGLHHDILDKAPVGDFTLVGLYFVVLFGLLPALADYGLVTRTRWEWTDPLNRWTGHLWGWTASVAVGAAMLIWIAVETAILGFLTGIGGTLQIIITLWALVILGLAAIPSVRKDMNLG